MNSSSSAQPQSAPAEVLSDFRKRNNQACLAAIDFEKTFYNTLRNNRIKFSELYHPNAKIVWCGNTIVGSSNILEFYTKLPDVEVQTTELDAQPYLPSTIQQILVTCGGKFRYKTASKWNNFVDHFVLIADGTKWKILSHVARIV